MSEGDFVISSFYLEFLGKKFLWRLTDLTEKHSVFDGALLINIYV